MQNVSLSYSLICKRTGTFLDTILFNALQYQNSTVQIFVLLLEFQGEKVKKKLLFCAIHILKSTFLNADLLKPHNTFMAVVETHRTWLEPLLLSAFPSTSSLLVSTIIVLSLMFFLKLPG